MKLCKRCLYPENHPLNITFDNKGICSGCKIHEEKDVLNWNERFNKLKLIIKPYKSSKRSINNCIVPVSGARDSFFIVHVVKNILKMNPILVTYNKQYNTEEGIKNLSLLKTVFGCPLLTNTISPKKIKKITKITLKKFGSIYWHCIAGQTVFPVQIACKMKIPLIIWGAHQGIDQVGMFSHLDEVEMTRKYRKEHDLLGFEAEDLLKFNLKKNDLEDFFYPEDNEIENVGVRGIYLNNYIRWDTKAQHEYIIKKYKYNILEQQRTFDNCNDVDCYHYSGLHDYIKLIKFGYSKVVDHATREIRLKRINRSDGIKLVRKYINKKPKDINIFLNWLGIKQPFFYKILNKFKNKSLSKIYYSNLKIKNKKKFLKKNKSFVFKKKIFNINYKKGKYILLGKGW